MVRSVVSKVMWLGRATVFVVGLAVILALVVGVASTALGANGANFILGSLNNSATAITKLTGTVGGNPALRISNPSAATGSTALDLQVATGKAPMKVNRTTKVTNLNADKVDGSDGEMWAQVLPDGSVQNWKGLTGNIRNSEGRYQITWERDVSKCAIIASHSGAPVSGLINLTPTNIQTWIEPEQPNVVHILSTHSTSGGNRDAYFDILVSCGDHQSAP
jgi:hypothetical protein